jgi:hypothetical protein
LIEVCEDIGSRGANKRNVAINGHRRAKDKIVRESDNVDLCLQRPSAAGSNEDVGGTLIGALIVVERGANEDCVSVD